MKGVVNVLQHNSITIVYRINYILQNYYWGRIGRLLTQRNGNAWKGSIHYLDVINMQYMHISNYNIVLNKCITC